MPKLNRPRTGLNARGVLLAAGVSALLCLPGLALSAQEDVAFSAFYVGRTDTNQDGLVDTNDIAVIYGATDDADVPLSDESVSVLQYAADQSDTDLTLAYTHGTESAATLVIALPGQELVSFPLSGITPARLALHNGLVYVLGTNAESIATLHVYDPAGGTSPIAQHSFRSPATAASLSATGNGLLGYNPESGGLSVFALPDVADVDFGLAGYARTAPVWSPAADVFMIGIGLVNTPDDVRIALVDGQTGAVTEWDVPNYPLETPLRAEWSSAGRFVSFAPANDPLAPVTMLDVTSGETRTLAADAQGLTVQSWSADDAYALVAARPADAPDAPISLFAYDVAADTLTALQSTTGVEISSIAWSDAGSSFVVVGRSAETGQTGVFAVDAAADTLTPIFETPEADISGVQWAGGDAVFFVAPSGDDLFSSGGVPTALYRASAAGGDVTRISDEGIIVTPQLLQVE